LKAGRYPYRTGIWRCPSYRSISPAD